MKSCSGLAERGMGFLFSGDQRGDLVPVVEELAEGVKDLGLGEVRSFRHLVDGFAAQVQRGHMPHGDPQTVDDRFATTNAFQAYDVRMFGFHDCSHERISFGELVYHKREATQEPSTGSQAIGAGRSRPKMMQKVHGKKRRRPRGSVAQAIEFPWHEARCPSHESGKSKTNRPPAFSDEWI
jgi:hypothetical protein